MDSGISEIEEEQGVRQVRDGGKEWERRKRGVNMPNMGCRSEGYA